jgi:hypothetical protein
VQSHLKRIARLMIALLLATQLAPTFAWEAAAPEADEAYEAHCDPEHEGASGHAKTASHHGHGCAGHMSGHLVGAVHELATLPARHTAQMYARVFCTFASAPLSAADQPPKPSDLV